MNINHQHSGDLSSAPSSNTLRNELQTYVSIEEEDTVGKICDRLTNLDKQKLGLIHDTGCIENVTNIIANEGNQRFQGGGGGLVNPLLAHRSSYVYINYHNIYYTCIYNMN